MEPIAKHQLNDAKGDGATISIENLLKNFKESWK